MCQFESEKEIAELLASLGVAAATSHLCEMPPSCEPIDPIDANYWRNQFASDDFTQTDYGDALHEYQCSHIRYPNKWFDLDGYAEMLAIANRIELPPRHITVADPGSVTPESGESKLPPAKRAKIASNQLSSPVQDGAPSQLETCFKSLAVLGGSLAAPPKKVTISLTFEL